MAWLDITHLSEIPSVPEMELSGAGIFRAPNALGTDE